MTRRKSRIRLGTLSDVSLYNRVMDEASGTGTDPREVLRRVDAPEIDKQVVGSVLDSEYAARAARRAHSDSVAEA